MDGSVLVLNADLAPLHRVSFKHAIRMLVRQKAEVHESEPDKTFGMWPMPKVVRLIRYVVANWMYNRSPRWSKRGVMIRDNGKCAYCSSAADTIDHVIPQSQNGKNTWKNTVACCRSCNQKKRNRTPAEAGMTLLIIPKIPKRTP